MQKCDKFSFATAMALVEGGWENAWMGVKTGLRIACKKLDGWVEKRSRWGGRWGVSHSKFTAIKSSEII